MFALCGLTIIVRVVYLGTLWQPAPADAGVRRRATGRLAAGRRPVRLGADAPSQARPVVLDDLEPDASLPDLGAGRASVTTSTTAPVSPGHHHAAAEEAGDHAPPPRARPRRRRRRPPPRPRRRPRPPAAPRPRAPPRRRPAASGARDRGGRGRRPGPTAGVASWFNAPDATCAHRTLPFGTMVQGHPDPTTARRRPARSTTGAPRWRPAGSSTCRLDTFEKLAPKRGGADRRQDRVVGPSRLTSGR